MNIIRASSWADLFDCPARWYAKNVQGLRLPSSGAAALGTAVHAGTAVYDAHAAHDLEAAIETAVQTAKEPEQDVLWDDDLPQGKAIDTAATLTADYCQTIGAHRQYAAVEVQCDALEIATEYGTVTITGTTDRVRQEDGKTGSLCCFTALKKPGLPTCEDRRRRLTSAERGGYTGERFLPIRYVPRNEGYVSVPQIFTQGERA